jgi:hypothetical protein
LFNEYFKTGGKVVKNVVDTNQDEVFYIPNVINRITCKYIKYGVNSIYKVLTTNNPKFYAESMVRQLEIKDRNFVYHIELLPLSRRRFSYFFNNNKIY